MSPKPKHEVALDNIRGLTQAARTEVHRVLSERAHWLCHETSNDSTFVAEVRPLLEVLRVADCIEREVSDVIGPEESEAPHG